MSINKSRFDIWAWLEKWRHVLTLCPVILMLFATGSALIPDWAFYAVCMAWAFLLFIVAIPPFVLAKRSEAARKQEEQRQLQELDEAVTRLHGNSQGAQ